MDLYGFIFYLSMSISIVAAVGILFSSHPMHGALCLLISILSLALVYVSLHAPLIASLQVMVYAGAIMVMMLFLIMILDLRRSQQPWWSKSKFIYLFTGLVLLAECIAIMLAPWVVSESIGALPTIKQIGQAMFGPYVLFVEALAMLLLAALVAVLYLSRSMDSGPPGHEKDKPL